MGPARRYVRLSQRSRAAPGRARAAARRPAAARPGLPYRRRLPRGTGLAPAVYPLWGGPRRGPACLFYHSFILK